MRNRRRLIWSSAVVGGTLVCSGGAVALGQVDNLHLLVDKTTGTGGNSIGTFAYDPATDSMYVTGFGAGAGLRKVTNVGGAQTSTLQVSESQLQQFYRDGNPDRGVGTPLQSGFLLNPKAVGSASAYSFALITDLGLTKFPSSTTNDPAASKRVYAYNLQQVSATGDGRDVFSTRVTLADMQGVAGVTTGTTSNTGRQFAWSGDGQSIYFTDASTAATAVGGLWKVAATGGTPVRLMAQDDLNTEPAVVTTGGVDKIFFRGGGSTGNLNGLDFVTHNGTTTSARQVAVTAAALRDFLEVPTTLAVTPFSMTSDADGNVYFNTTTSTSTADKRPWGLYKLDPQGRLSKVTSYAERLANFGGTAAPAANMLREQARTVTYSGGPGTPFPLTQILYAENNIDSVVAADVFKTGDFNRDNAVTAADVALFKGVLTTRGVQQTNVGNLKYDLNGNNAVDWKDLKIFQQFYAFKNGDTDIGGQVNYADLDTLFANYQGTAKTWLQGDLSGDETVNAADLTLLAPNWDLVTPTLADLDAHGYTGQFRSDAAAAFGLVPEPTSALAAAGLAALGLIGRRRRRGHPMA